ncbi:MAG: hypothetical protein ABSA51_05075 [Anaerolineaceae bacterium]|jgi:hypothetical protein
MSDFHGLPTATLANEHLRLEYLTKAGPRIVGLSYLGSPNLLGDVFDECWETPHGQYYLLGGHRLWISPEIPEKTYIPDKTGLLAREFPGGVELTGEHETGSGVRKSLRIELESTTPIIRLTHTILNENAGPITVAPWAISMFSQGGTVILPQPVGNSDPHGLLNNRLIALWPKTRINDSRLILRDDFILIRATSGLPPIKIGYSNTAGWLAYWKNGILFRKSFDLHPGSVYPDGGCNTESYCGDRFVELETLGPLQTLASGATAYLTETWELQGSLDSNLIPEEMKKLVQNG